MILKPYQPAFVDVLKEGLHRSSVVRDIMAGVIVGIVALPLAVAFAMASGVKPEQGLVTAIVTGLVISVFSGSRVQVGGPTGAFIILLYEIVRQHGYEGLAAATFIAGVLLILMGIAQLGDVIKYIPFPVTVGFTSGIAVVIFSTQIRDALGLEIASLPDSFAAKWAAYLSHLPTVHPWTLLLTVLTILIIFLWPKITFRIPATLAAIVITSAAAAIFDLPVETIGSRFGQISNSFPRPSLPHLHPELIIQMLRPAVSIAMLAGIESLLSAVVADGMTGRRHRSNAELIAQGIANLVSPVFGGIPATGAIARTATNIKNGGTTPIAGIVHALTVLLIFLFFGKQAASIPMATLAGILIVVAYNMSEYHLFFKLLRGPRSDVLVLCMTFLLTILVDLSVAIEVGIVLAAFLFMRRMIIVSQAGWVTSQIGNGDSNSDDPLATSKRRIPAGVEVFEINGPFFFGATEKFKTIMQEVEKPPKILILRMRHVPMMDATGMKALEEVILRMQAHGTAVILSGVNAPVRAVLRTGGLIRKVGRKNILFNIDQALMRAEKILTIAVSGTEPPRKG